MRPQRLLGCATLEQMKAVALLRGINVGGNRMVPMARLRELLSEMGLTKVTTLLQSGNAMFECRSLKGLGRKIEDALERELGFRPAVIVRSGAEIAQVVAANPFAGRADVPGDRLLVTFLADEPAHREVNFPPEEAYVIGREMFVYFPDGMGRSKFPWAALEKTLGVRGTARNWNTVVKISEVLKRMTEF